MKEVCTGKDCEWRSWCKRYLALKEPGFFKKEVYSQPYLTVITEDCNGRRFMPWVFFRTHAFDKGLVEVAEYQGMLVVGPENAEYKYTVHDWGSCYSVDGITTCP